jgi:broad specificity phosphatase PhoE
LFFVSNFALPFFFYALIMTHAIALPPDSSPQVDLRNGNLRLPQPPSSNIQSKRIILVRHGQTDYNFNQLVQGRKIDAVLNPIGLEQAKQLGNRLKHEEIDYVACSTLRRTRQTCEAILGSHPMNSKLSCEFFDDLQEMSYGELEGKSFDPSKEGNVKETLAHYAEAWERDKRFDLQLPGGESPLEVEQRAATLVRQIAREKVKHQGLIVCHGRLLRVLLCSLLGVGLDKMGHFPQENCAVNILEYDDASDTFSRILLNDFSHLES